MKMRLTCADVKKPLASVMKIVKKGNQVVFDEEGSYIRNKKTGTRTEMREEHGVYVFDIWIPSGRGVDAVNTAINAEVFRRQ